MAAAADRVIDIGKTDQLGLIEDQMGKQVSIVYQKVEAVMADRKMVFSIFSSGQIGATTLVESINLRRRVGVNCYAFAVGRVPNVSGKAIAQDPIPGGTFIDEIREGIQDFIFEVLPSLSGIKRLHFFTKKAFRRRSSSYRLKDLVTFIEQLPDVFLPLSGGAIPDFKAILLQPSDVTPRLKRFVEIYFQRTVQECISDEKTFKELQNILLEDYRVQEEKMDPTIVESLLKLDGLIKVYPLESQEDEDKLKGVDFGAIEFGVPLIAAFSKAGDDYHFMRLFGDGWYEREGDTIRKNPIVPEGIPMGKKEEIGKVFYPNGAKEFIGYFFVPTEVIVTDGIGRSFLTESHKT